METQDVAVFDSVGDGVRVELLGKEIFGGSIRGLLALDLLIHGIFIEDGGARETKELGAREEVFDRGVVVAELGTVAFVKDENDAFVAQRLQLFLVGGSTRLSVLPVALTTFVQCQTEFLDRGNDDFICVVIGEKATHQCAGVRVFFDATLLESVELLAGLPVEILAVHDEDAFLDVWIVF